MSTFLASVGGHHPAGLGGSAEQAITKAPPQLSDAWEDVCLRILPLFNGGQIGPAFLENTAALVRTYTAQLRSGTASMDSNRSIETELISQAERDLKEVIAAGMLSLRAKLDSVNQDRLLTRLLEIWSVFPTLCHHPQAYIDFTLYLVCASALARYRTLFFYTLLPTLQATFLALPFQSRGILLQSFTEHLLLPLLPRLEGLVIGLAAEESESHDLFLRSVKPRLQQMLLILGHMSDLSGATNSASSIERLLHSLLTPTQAPVSNADKRKAWIRVRRKASTNVGPVGRSPRATSKFTYPLSEGQEEEYLYSLRSPDPSDDSADPMTDMELTLDKPKDRKSAIFNSTSERSDRDPAEPQGLTNSRIPPDPAANSVKEVAMPIDTNTVPASLSVRGGLHRAARKDSRETLRSRTRNTNLSSDSIGFGDWDQAQADIEQLLYPTRQAAQRMG